MSINYKSTRMFQHILSLFIHMAKLNFFYYNDITIFDINPKLKGTILKAPKGLNYSKLKEWSIEKALEILKSRNDEYSINIINKNKGKSKSKSDDLSDTVIQMEAWFIYNNGLITTNS